MNPTHEEIEAKIALLEVQLKLSEAAERAWESSMMRACGEDGPKSVADKFAELESKLETALRECRSAGITIDNLEAKCSALAADNEKAMEAMRQADAAVKLAHEKFSSMAAENAALKESEREFDKMCAEEFGPDWVSEFTETPATDAFLAEVRAKCLNAFIQHHSAELDAHIKNGGDQFDEKSVRIRDIIVSARLFREQISKGGNQ
nr:MAG TPA: hypothetical protein [Caudoviricetes sp.]